MANNITATLVVDFRSNDGGMLIAEVDSRPEGYNAGRSSFAPGEQPVFLLHKSDDVTIDLIELSSSLVSAVPIATGTLLVEEDLQFVKESQASLSKPFASAFTWKWLGNSLGTPQVVGQSKVTVPSAGLGVLRVTYRSAFTAYRLTGVPTTLNGETSFPIIVYILGHTD